MSKPPFRPGTRYIHLMIGKMLNLPFKVLGGVARAVQTQEAKKWAEHAERDAASARSVPGMSISVPSDFDPGPIHVDAKTHTQYFSFSWGE